MHSTRFFSINHLLPTIYVILGRVPSPQHFTPAGALAMSWLWVMLGGAVGAGARYGLVLALGPVASRTGFPWAILVINVLGSFLLGLTLALVGRNVWTDATRLAFGTGVLGAFTTFSTFSVDVDQMLQRGHSALATAYVVASVLFGVLAAMFGRVIGEKL